MHAPASSLSDTVKPSPALDRYRPDIDGLRAIAVLSVVIFHAFPEALASGFVGVDIFFVISGFLITSIILSDLDKERFSFATFYARRIRRIFPALLVVLTVCIVAGWFLLLPDEYRLFGNHLMAGTGFVANLEFLREPTISTPQRTPRSCCISGRSASRSNIIWLGRSFFGQPGSMDCGCAGCS